MALTIFLTVLFYILGLTGLLLLIWLTWISISNWREGDLGTAIGGFIANFIIFIITAILLFFAISFTINLAMA